MMAHAVEAVQAVMKGETVKTGAATGDEPEIQIMRVLIQKGLMMVRQVYNGRMLSSFPGVLILFIVKLSLSVSPAMAGEADGQMSFASPVETVSALVAAVRENDDARLLKILGPGSGDLISSGDRVADQKGRDRFLKAYEEKNRLDLSDEDRAVLIVGSKDYPFPIPIVRLGDSWRFDTPSGMDEILNRRIGRNELHTIEVMLAYIDAQREYACMARGDGGKEFAQKFASSEGKKDGLYWQVAEGEAESPFGPLIARAAREGYAGGLNQTSPEPFHGYYFNIIKAQGEHASGGAFDYVADGKMVLGFALVAYPAKYGASGIMTFIVNQEGVIYEKDLGEETATVAAAMTAFDPDDTWRKYEKSAE